MATETVYDKLISSTAKGVVDADKLQYEIHKSDSGISIQCKSIDTGVTGADNLRITMKDALPTTPVDQEVLLDGLIAAHDGTIPLKNTESVHVTPQVGGFAVLTDGIEIEADSNAGICVGAEYPLHLATHLQGVNAQWKNMQLGDRSILCVIHKGTVSALESQVEVDADSFVLPNTLVGGTTPITALYDPQNGAQVVEFWDNSNPSLPLLVEAHEIDDVDMGTRTVNLKTPIKNQHTIANCILKVRFGGYTVLRDDNTGVYLTGGFRMLGDGFLMMRNEVAVTETLPDSMCLGARLALKNQKAGLREFVLNYFFRDMPDNE